MLFAYILQSVADAEGMKTGDVSTCWPIAAWLAFLTSWFLLTDGESAARWWECDVWTFGIYSISVLPAQPLRVPALTLQSHVFGDVFGDIPISSQSWAENMILHDMPVLWCRICTILYIILIHIVTDMMFLVMTLRAAGWTSLGLPRGRELKRIERVFVVIGWFLIVPFGVRMLHRDGKKILILYYFFCLFEC